MSDDTDIALLCDLMRSNGRPDLADLIAPGRSELNESSNYGSRLFSVLSSFLIYLPQAHYLKAKNLSANEKDFILQNVLHLYPAMDHAPEVISIDILLDKNLAETVVRAPILNRSSELKVFISYSTNNKIEAGKIKAFYDQFGLPAFLAHEDLVVSVPWRERIVEELKQSSVFVALLSKEFRGSDWTSQEIGMAAYSDDMIFIPLSMDGTIPYGFISHVQSVKFDEKALFDNLIVPILRKDSRVVDKLIQYLSEIKYGFRDCEMIIGAMEPYFDRFAQY